MAPVAEPATLDDVPAIAEIFFSGFNDDYFQPVFPQTLQGCTYIEEAYASFITGKEGRQKSQVFVIRDQTGTSAAFIKSSRAADRRQENQPRRFYFGLFDPRTKDCRLGQIVGPHQRRQ